MPDQSRYPGTRPFLEEDRHLFFGRDHDKKKLSNLIVLEKLVVLFGKSGYGKSSLLNAGVIPYLRHTKHHFPIKIRFMPPDVATEGPMAKPLEILKNHLVPQIEILKKDLEQKKGASCFLAEKLDIPKLVPDDLTAVLWYYIKFIQLTKEIDEATTLIFYQFEELFRYFNDLDADEFGRSLAALLHPNPPDEVLELIRKNLSSFTDEELEQLYEPLNLKIVFSVASDHLSLLNKLKPSLPEIFKYTYELRALNKQQAQEALEGPARKNEKFNSPKFSFSPEAIDKIFDYLIKVKNKEGIELENQDIETFQLQLIGQYAEEKIIGIKRKTDLKAKVKGWVSKEKDSQEEATKFEFSLKDLGEPTRILKKFYNKIIRGLSPLKGLRAKNLIEKGLIIDGNRVPISGSAIKRDYKVYEDTLGKLEEKHLLRSEFKLKDGNSTKSYEISHYNLVKPILDSIEKRKRKRLWIAIFLLLFLLLILGLYSLWPDASSKDDDKPEVITNTEEEEVSNGLIINAIGTSTVFPTNGPAPLDVDFIFSKVDTIGDVRILSYNWDFDIDNDHNDDTTTSNNNASVRHTYYAPGVYTARLTVTTNDSLYRIRTEEVKIIVDSTASPTVKVNLSASPDSGETPLKVNFKGTLSPDSTLANRYLWEFNDGDTSVKRNPEYIFREDGTYNVRLTIWGIDGKNYVGSLNIKVGIDSIPAANPNNKAPIALFGTSRFDANPLKVAFDGSASTDDVAINRYLWEFNDGETSEEVSPSHTFESNRDYNVRLTVWDSEGLKNSANEIIKIPDLRRAEVMIIPSDTLGIAPFPVDFVVSNAFNTYKWNFPDSTSSSLPNPKYVFGKAGTYEVQLTVTDINGMKARAKTIVTIDPQAVISVSDTLGTAPFKVGFEVSNANRQYEWIFPDGTSSDIASPTHVFGSVGTHKVYLTASNSQGLTVKDTVQITVRRNKPPIAEIKSKVILDDSSPFAVEFDGSGSSDDGEIMSYDWNFGDGQISNDSIALHTYNAAGTYDVKLRVIDDQNQRGDTIVPITVCEVNNSEAEVLAIFKRVQDKKLPAEVNSQTRWENWRMPTDSLNFVVILNDSLSENDSNENVQIGQSFFFAKNTKKLYQFAYALDLDESIPMYQSERFNIKSLIKQANRDSKKNRTINESEMYTIPHKPSFSEALAELFGQNNITNRTQNVYYTLLKASDFDESTQKILECLTKQ